MFVSSCTFSFSRCSFHQATKSSSPMGMRSHFSPFLMVYLCVWLSYSTSCSLYHGSSNNKWHEIISNGIRSHKISQKNSQKKGTLVWCVSVSSSWPQQNEYGYGRGVIGSSNISTISMLTTLIKFMWSIVMAHDISLSLTTTWVWKSPAERPFSSN